jgi:hypothetical protein
MCELSRLDENKEMTMRKLQFFVLLASALFMSACSSGGSDSPSDTNTHPASWFSTHAVEATANPGYGECRTCHGPDLTGNGDAVSCYSCHSYNTEPPFTTHPPEWDETYTDHRGYAATNGTDSCTACHGPTLQGYQTAPSCFAASFNGQSCHPDGPGEAPHPLDGSYLLGTNHGLDAKSDLTVCQACHGQPGGPGSNPRFNLGIIAAGDQGCEPCHGVDFAHPQTWAGPNPVNVFHYQAGNIQNACTLCHGVNLDGLGTPQPVGVSCLGCHAETVSFTLDCTYCHGTPPDGSADLDVPIPVPHGSVANISLHDVCVTCHGMKESATGGSFSATANYTLYAAATETNGDHWNGNIEMNSVPQYNAANFGCDAAGCHGNNPAHQLSDSGLPVNLKAFGSGDSVPHPLDDSFLDPANHGPAAKGLTASFPNGMLDCQPCHAQPPNSGPGSNPRFNVGINAAGGAGCESCHSTFTAHPTVGIPDTQLWYNNATYIHSDVTAFSMCTLCHGAAYEGGSGPACTSCHNESPVSNSTGCVSCHNQPPDNSAPVGANRPNTQGRHFTGDHEDFNCSACHNGAGANTPDHYDLSAPANVIFSGGGTYDSNTSTCSNVGCHGSETWY